jgi:uncharacterized protein YfaS (alpha-2-macroglobulin family)
MKHPLLWFTAVLAIASAVVLLSFPAPKAANITATFSRGVLHVGIPYDGIHSGTGLLTVEVLDPEDQVLGRTEHRVDIAAGKGAWDESVRFDKAISSDDLVWQRLRYRFTYTDQEDAALEGTDAISEILRRPVIHILGQQSYLAGGAAAIRVIVTDSQNQVIAGATSLRIELAPPDQKARMLFSGQLDGRGTTEAQFRFPAGVVGNFPLHYVVDSPLGSTEFTQQVRLEDKVSILLTTEKPIYQPGQTIHVRTLALDRANHEAAANRKMTFEVQDSRGNKVFKKVTQTDKFGVASAEFGLADEVNLGAYHLHALLDQDGSKNSAELALNVEKYVLPKFKVAVEFAGADSKVKRGYRPGDHVTGTVHANYFFGKAVDGGEVTVKGSGMDVAMFEVGSVQGKTDRDGVYHFDMKLPNYFAGRPLSGGAARVVFEATVKDGAGHSETSGESITVSESPLIITAIPEGGTLIPNLENQVFVLTSYPDGKPAVADVKARVAGSADQSVATDEGGVAVIRIKAGNGGDALKLEASDKEGNRASNTIQLKGRTGGDQVLLRTERAVYRGGDRIQLRVFSTKERGSAYVDVVKDGQTVLTRDVEIVNGQAELVLAASPELAGTLDISAYLFGGDARPVADHRLVFVEPADELKISAEADAAVYKPGDDARIRFRVTNAKGEGVQAALGVQVVDEAVFALAEKQPGFAKVFFYLEQEALKPRYEIHSLGLPEIVEPVAKARAEQRDRAARALFSATEMVSGNRFEVDAGKEPPMAKYQSYATRYRERFVATVPASLTSVYGKSGGDLTKDPTDGVRPRDPWGTELRIDRLPWGQRQYMVRSAGPDKRFNTWDDLTMAVIVRGGSVQGPGSVVLKIEHNRGPATDFGEIVGTVADPSGAVVAVATVKIVETSTGNSRTAITNARGEFTLAGVPAGKYDVQVTSPGFLTGSVKLALDPRDRAVLSTVLGVGDVENLVTVKAAPMRVGIGGGAGARLGAAMGIVGGVAGGVPGGIPRAMAAPAQKDGGVLMAGAGLVMAESLSVANHAVALKEKITSPEPRVRSYFPEALYINPEIITDQRGLANISIPMADSITTWRMAMLASTARGALGSGTSSIKVFQDFFVDLDLPVTLTQGDRVSVPVAVYNYSTTAGDVSLRLQPDDWFSLVEDVPQKNVAVEPGRVGAAQFTIAAKRIGKFKLRLAANMKGRADIVVREIEVIPDGREQTQVFNGRLETAVQHEVKLPAATIPDSAKIFVRLYPGPLSQVIEGMDAILRMPGGCFEQTSSSTYPNVLALDYMKRTRKSTPEVHAKAEGYIANGYQRLLTFEVPGGGFSWFGQAPANKILTAYGLMEFSDMSKVYDVDPNVIRRTQQWLASQQQADGSWKPDTNFINEGATNRYNTDVLRITAYIAWSLGNTGYQGPAIEKARQYVGNNMGASKDAYTRAVIANFAVDSSKDSAFTNQAMQALLDLQVEKDEQISWTAEETGVYGRGASASIETTGLAVQALIKWGRANATVQKALTYIAAKKDASGTWGTTQATIMALRALLLSTEKGTADVRGTVEVTLNGKAMEKLTLTAESNDLLHQFVLKNIDAKTANTVAIRFEGNGGLAYQVVGQYFIPWKEKPANEPLSISVKYDRTNLAQDDVASATVTARNNMNKVANMVMIDVGIPPGFDLLAEDLQAFQEKSANRKGGRLEKFSMTATQAILYFDSIGAGETVTVPIRLRAKYPIRARTFQSRVYEYYDPEMNSVAQPVQLEVQKR